MSHSISTHLDRIAQHSPVAVVGSLNADITVRTPRFPGPGETVSGEDLEILPGGKSANQAVQAGLLGAAVTMIGTVGQDANATVLLDSLRSAGVRMDAVATAPVSTGTAVITVNDQGENTIIVSPGANAHTDVALVERHADEICQAKALGLCLEVGLDVVIRAAQIAHEAGATVILNDSPFRADLPSQLLELTDVLVVNEHELQDLLEHHDLVSDLPPVQGNGPASAWAARGDALVRIGIDRAIITLGAHGSVVLDRGEVTAVNAVPVEVVDTTGAGDSFLGSVLSAVASGASLVEAAHLASVVSGQSTTKMGAQASYAAAEDLRRL